MSLDRDHLHACLSVVAEVVGNRRRTGAQIPGWIVELRHRLAVELEGVSACGRHGEVGEADSMVIGTAEAAVLLGCTARAVRRRVVALGGWRVRRDWLFDRHVIADYRDPACKGAKACPTPRS